MPILFQCNLSLCFHLVLLLHRPQKWSGLHNREMTEEKWLHNKQINTVKIFLAPRSQKRRKEKVKVLVTQSCPTLCNPMDYSLPGSSVHGIFRQEYWSRLPCHSPEDLLDPVIESGLLHCRQILYCQRPKRVPKWANLDFFHLHIKYGFVRLTSYKEVLKCEADLKMEYNQWKHTHTHNQYKNINETV